MAIITGAHRRIPLEHVTELGVLRHTTLPPATFSYGRSVVARGPNGRGRHTLSVVLQASSCHRNTPGGGEG